MTHKEFNTVIIKCSIYTQNFPTIPIMAFVVLFCFLLIQHPVKGQALVVMILYSSSIYMSNPFYDTDILLYAGFFKYLFI